MPKTPEPQPDHLATTMARLLAPALIAALVEPLARAVAKEMASAHREGATLLTPRQARAQKRCSMKVLLAALHSGELPAEKRAGPGGAPGTIAGRDRWYISVTDLDAWQP